MHQKTSKQKKIDNAGTPWLVKPRLAKDSPEMHIPKPMNNKYMYVCLAKNIGCENTRYCVFYRRPDEKHLLQARMGGCKFHPKEIKLNLRRIERSKEDEYIKKHTA